MGIHRFFPWFKNQFSMHIKKVGKKQTLTEINVGIDTLMIDMNGIIHNSAQKIYEYGNFKPLPSLLRKHRKPGGLQAQLKLFEDVCLTVENLIKIVNPSKRLVLCVDGPAPSAKQSQQRSRRFRSSKESSDDSSFNTSCISPGTKFMDYLDKYIDWYIRKRINQDPEWRKFQVIYSSEKVPGEGEHQCVNFIRQYGNPDETFCISGLDADLIMLALGTHMPKFYILREDLYDSNNDFFCIDIGSIRSDLSNLLRWKENKYIFDSKRSIDDFIFLCFMVGNDFLPHIPSIEIIENGLELILEVYRETGTSYGHITQEINGNVKFCPETLGVFLGTIGQHEKSNFEQKLRKKNSFFPDPILDKCSVQNEGKWAVDIEKYKTDYYTACFPPDTDEEKLCHDYLEGMQWVLSYYTRGVSNWKWNFRYHYAPPASILANHTKTFKFPHYGRTIPSSAFQQLLCILPPKSAHLLPEQLAKLLTDEMSPIKKYCPDNFEIDLGGKRKEFEGIVLVPMIDVELVRDCYLENLGKIDSRELKRNLVRRSVVYEYIPGLHGSFISYYGNIEKCSVRTMFIDI